MHPNKNKTDTSQPFNFSRQVFSQHTRFTPIMQKLTNALNLYILNTVRCPYVCRSVMVHVASSVANDITRMTS